MAEANYAEPVHENINIMNEEKNIILLH